MPESVATIPAAGEIGEASDAPASTARASMSSPKLAGLMALVVALTVCGTSWVHYEGSQILEGHQQMKSRAPGAANPSEMEFLARVGRWQLAMTLVMAGGGGVLILIAASGFRKRERIPTQPPAPSEVDWRRQARELRAQLAGRDRVEGEMRKERGELLVQIADLTRSKALLDEELNRRRQAEKSLAQQRQELARSKDVLELHVRARTQEVEKLQRRSELILNSAAEGICGFDLQGKVTFANPAAARVMGLSVADMIGQPEQNLFPAFRTRSGLDAA